VSITSRVGKNVHKSRNLTRLSVYVDSWLSISVYAFRLHNGYTERPKLRCDEYGSHPSVDVTDVRCFPYSRADQPQLGIFSKIFHSVSLDCARADGATEISILMCWYVSPLQGHSSSL
jgi:hypothetical protein